MQDRKEKIDKIDDIIKIKICGCKNCYFGKIIIFIKLSIIDVFIINFYKRK